MKNLTYLTFILTLTSLACFADEKSLYDFKWLDEGEKVYVIQNKEYVKARSIGLDLSIIDSNSSPYQDTSGFSLALAYYFTETWSIDLTYKMYNNSDSADLTNLLNINVNTTQTKPLIRKINAAKLIHINWIPFYGKINTFNKIFFFDWGLGLGFGQFDTSGNYETFDKKNLSITFKDEVDTGFNLRSFAKFYIGQSMTMGFEYNLTGVETIKSIDGSKEILYYNDIIGTIGYIF
ncbi:MAG: hypothetical protein HON90_14660 [Halobacteriovoraceae bacterium]|jgi:outer membrane beta-barrel protein|nr:hypothetical protein [Halobacteriovoraceae bacterium]